MKIDHDLAPLWGALLLAACQPGPAEPPTTDTSGSSGSTSMVGDSSSALDGTATGDSSTGGGPVDCNFSTYPDDIVFDTAAAVELSDAVARLALVGSDPVACGDGFVEVGGGGPPLAIDGRCTGLAALDETRGVVVTDTGTTVLFEIAAGQATALDTVLDVAAQHHDVATSGSSIFVASGIGGLSRFDPVGDALGMPTAVPGATDPRGLASTAAGLLVADGRDGARLVDPDGGGSIFRLDLDPGEASKRTARRVVVDGERAFVLRGVFGVSVLDIGDGMLSLDSSHAVEGPALDAAVADGDLLVATGSALVRLDLDTGTVPSRQAQPAYGELAAEWFRTITPTPEGLLATAGARMAPVTLGAGEPQPLLFVDRATYSFWASPGTSTQTIVSLDNGGAEPLILADLAAGSFGLEPLNLDERVGCPGQYTVDPGDRGLVQLSYDDPSAEVLLTSFDATTNTSDEAMLALRVEVNRGEPEVGEAGPAFDLLDSEGQRSRAADYPDRVVFLKIFNET